MMPARSNRVAKWPEKMTYHTEPSGSPCICTILCTSTQLRHPRLAWRGLRHLTHYVVPVKNL